MPQRKKNIHWPVLPQQIPTPKPPLATNITNKRVLKMTPLVNHEVIRLVEPPLTKLTVVLPRRRPRARTRPPRSILMMSSRCRRCHSVVVRHVSERLGWPWPDTVEWGWRGWVVPGWGWWWRPCRLRLVRWGWLLDAHYILLLACLHGWESERAMWFEWMVDWEWGEHFFLGLWWIGFFYLVVCACVLGNLQRVWVRTCMAYWVDWFCGTVACWL